MEAILSVMLIQSPTAAGLIGKAQLEDIQIACDLGLTHAEGGAQILAQSRRSVEGDGAVGTLVEADSEDHGGEPVNVISVKMGEKKLCMGKIHLQLIKSVKKCLLTFRAVKAGVNDQCFTI